ncbi:MAG: hypothetical protein F6K18_05045 [Okeania sp. SIO2C2]|uniref:hypothetical protein n=1 Tax=Okeania sp. SIO2C2 TaxID=2607787 RepID=UPI0013B65821|nr:hypothetical protein [Okeania sp. SIO2C2]NEP86238.1 hypothetical protein [Okeania sp. SIO2C2]
MLNITPIFPIKQRPIFEHSIEALSVSLQSGIGGPSQPTPNPSCGGEGPPQEIENIE